MLSLFGSEPWNLTMALSWQNLIPIPGKYFQRLKNPATEKNTKQGEGG